MARDLSLSALARLQRRGEERFLRNLYCHYVFDDQLKEFEQIVVRLKQLGTFVDTPTCVAMAKGERPIDGAYFHLSFDDGFKNNFANAAPILHRHRVPCMFFVPSGLIDADWETTADYCLNTAEYRAVIEMASWDDLRRAQDLGFEIGSHTRTHARFSQISSDPVRMRDEIAGSKVELEQYLGAPCDYISWPFGKPSDADPASLGFVTTAGYRACFGAYRGTVRPGETDIFSIPRHHFEAQWPISHIQYFAQGNRES